MNIVKLAVMALTLAVMAIVSTPATAGEFSSKVGVPEIGAPVEPGVIGPQDELFMATSNIVANFLESRGDPLNGLVEEGLNLNLATINDSRLEGRLISEGVDPEVLSYASAVTVVANYTGCDTLIQCQTGAVISILLTAQNKANSICEDWSAHNPAAAAALRDEPLLVLVATFDINEVHDINVGGGLPANPKLFGGYRIPSATYLIFPAECGDVFSQPARVGRVGSSQFEPLTEAGLEALLQNH